MPRSRCASQDATRRTARPAAVAGVKAAAAAAAASSGRPPPRSTEASDEGQAGEEEMPDASAGGKVSP